MALALEECQHSPSQCTAVGYTASKSSRPRYPGIALVVADSVP
ncbi:hypothetical protein CU044_5119 [Streptomyces sp. L-9-10]|nr:hypothetical protein CU044_5119 [Streptomyces sp. L-9-10]